MNTKEQLLRNVLAIIEELESPRDVLADDPSIVMQANEGCRDGYTWDDSAEVWRDMDGDEVETVTQSGFDYIAGALDIEFTICAPRRGFLGARVVVTVGGPFIYIDTRHNTVTGYWGSDTVTRSYSDEIGLHDAAADLFEMGV